MTRFGLGFFKSIAEEPGTKYVKIGVEKIVVLSAL